MNDKYIETKVKSLEFILHQELTKNQIIAVESFINSIYVDGFLDGCSSETEEDEEHEKI